MPVLVRSSDRRCTYCYKDDNTSHCVGNLSIDISSQSVCKQDLSTPSTSPSPSIYVEFPLDATPTSTATPTERVPYRPNGFTYDFCSPGVLKSVGERRCYDLYDYNNDGTANACPHDSKSFHPCNCRSRSRKGKVIPCVRSSQCPVGDRCIYSKNVGYSACASCQFSAVYTSNRRRYCLMDTDTSNCVGLLPQNPLELCPQSFKEADMTVMASPDITKMDEGLSSDPPSADVIFPTQTPTPLPQNQYAVEGYTGDVCRMDSECSAEWKCIARISNTTAAIPCTSNTLQCRCLFETDNSLNHQTCVSGSTECNRGDRCIMNIQSMLRHCISCQAPAFLNSADHCYVDLDTSNCVGALPSLNISLCTAILPSPMESPTTVETVTTSEPIPDDDDNNEPICIAVSSLTHIDTSQLVYKSHRTASVLCDPYENCATPGHMVEYRGQLMMMRSYCALLEANGCARRVRKVNSPRMEIGLRIETRNDELQFTPLAARFETKIEEKLFRTLFKISMHTSNLFKTEVVNSRHTV